MHLTLKQETGLISICPDFDAKLTADFLYSHLTVARRDFCTFIRQCFVLRVQNITFSVNPSYKITSLCAESFVQPKSMKDHSK